MKYFIPIFILLSCSSSKDKFTDIRDLYVEYSELGSTRGVYDKRDRYFWRNNIEKPFSGTVVDSLNHLGRLSCVDENGISISCETTIIITQVKDGFVDGKKYIYSNNLLTEEYSYKKGEYHGLSIFYYNNGNKKREFIFKNGEKLDERCYKETGEIFLCEYNTRFY